MTDKDSVNVSDAASILGLSKNTIRAYCEKGLLPYTRSDKNYRCFNVGDLLKMRKDLNRFEKKSQALGKKLFWLKQRKKNQGEGEESSC